MIYKIDTIEVPISGLSELIEDSPEHTGERFSGWKANYDISVLPWVDEVMSQISSLSDNLGPRRDGSTWINVLKGRGAEIEEHNEGISDADITIVLFLSTFEEDEGGRLIVGDESIVPVTGKYVIFDSNMLHRVTPLETDKPRVSAAALFAPIV
jgi:hypothetical protein